MNNENELDTEKEEKALNWILIVMVIVQILTGIAFWKECEYQSRSPINQQTRNRI